jgi:hypothetical protein
MARERRALERIGDLTSTPTLLFASEGLIVRGWIDGLPLQVAQPHGDAAYFKHARATLYELHRRASCTTISRSNRTGCAGATGSAT